jgi:N-acetylmuramoyl-L-alanine amidase
VVSIMVLSLTTLLDTPNAQASGIAGMSVFLDPGHSGINDSSITKQVPNGRGGTKDCETTGTSTNDGYPEHSFNWDVATRVRSALDQLGVHTQMSRADDSQLHPASMSEQPRPTRCIPMRISASTQMADLSQGTDST